MLMMMCIDKRWLKGIELLTYSVLLFSVVTKLFCIPYISQKFHLLGLEEFCYLFGAIELVAIVLFLNKNTIGLGLILLSCYFGGAIASDLQAPNYLYQPLVVITLVMITAFIRKPILFHDRLIVRNQSNDKIAYFEYKNQND